MLLREKNPEQRENAELRSQLDAEKRARQNDESDRIQVGQFRCLTPGPVREKFSSDERTHRWARVHHTGESKAAGEFNSGKSTIWSKEKIKKNQASFVEEN